MRAVIALPLEEVEQLYRSGHNVLAIAKHFDCSTSTVRKRMHEAGLPFREWGKAPYRQVPLDVLTSWVEQLQAGDVESVVTAIQATKEKA